MYSFVRRPVSPRSGPQVPRSDSGVRDTPCGCACPNPAVRSQTPSINPLEQSMNSAFVLRFSPCGGLLYARRVLTFQNVHVHVHLVAAIQTGLNRRLYSSSTYPLYLPENQARPRVHGSSLPSPPPLGLGSLFQIWSRVGKLPNKQELVRREGALLVLLHQGKTVAASHAIPGHVPALPPTTEAFRHRLIGPSCRQPLPPSAQTRQDGRATLHAL